MKNNTYSSTWLTQHYPTLQNGEIPVLVRSSSGSYNLTPSPLPHLTNDSNSFHVTPAPLPPPYIVGKP